MSLHHFIHYLKQCEIFSSWIADVKQKYSLIEAEWGIITFTCWGGGPVKPTLHQYDMMLHSSLRSANAVGILSDGIVPQECLRSLADGNGDRKAAPSRHTMTISVNSTRARLLWAFSTPAWLDYRIGNLESLGARPALQLHSSTACVY